MVETFLPGFAPTDIELVRSLSLSAITERAISLLQQYEPPDRYYLAFSAGKDSIVIKKLAQMAGVAFDLEYNFTTIDPPELVRFLKTEHPDAHWNRPPMNMMAMVASINKPPPTRGMRWCCEIFKEYGGDGRACIFGVRAAESHRRKMMWREFRDDHDKKRLVVCPIVYWSDEQVWQFIRHHNLHYCELYDQGFTRIGCVDCPLAKAENRQRERERWPIMAENWKRAIIKNWQRMKDMKRLDGKHYMHAYFKTGEDLYKWWTQEHGSDVYREDCQLGLVFTNQELDTE